MFKSKCFDGPPGCCICRNKFNSYAKGRTPRILTCNHSSCEDCVQNFMKMKEAIHCGVCSKISRLLFSDNEPDIDASFPINTYLLGMYTTKESSSDNNDSLISFSKKSTSHKHGSPKYKYDDYCSECGKLPKTHCESCDTDFCIECFKMVHRSEMLKGHKSIPLSVVSTLSVPNYPRPSTMCSLHPSKHLELVCTQCNVSICSLCLISQHNGHTLSTIEEKNQDLMDQVIDSYARNQQALEALKISLKKAKHCILQVEKRPSAPSFEKRIKEHFLELHSHLLRIESNLLNRVRGSGRKESLYNAVDLLTSKLNKVQSVLQEAKHALTQDGADLSQVLNQLKALEKIRCVLIAVDTDVEEGCLNIDKNIFNSLEDHVHVKVSETLGYDLKNLDDAANGLDDLPEKSQPEEIRQLLFGSPKMPSASFSDYMTEFTFNRPLSRSSSSSSLSTSSLPHSIDTTVFLSPPDDLIRGMSVNVQVTHIVSPSNFFIQRSSAQNSIALFNQQLQRIYSYKRCQRHIRNFEIGGTYVTFSEEAQCWYRCVILKIIDDTKVRVRYMDLGSVEIALKNNLLALPNSLICLPPLAFECSLYDCYPISGHEWSTDALAKMARILSLNERNTSVTIIQHTRPRVFGVKLYVDNDTHVIDVAVALAFAGLARLGIEDHDILGSQIPQTPPPKSLPEQPPLLADKASGIPVRLNYVESPHKFYVVPTHPDFSIFYNGFVKDYKTKKREINERRVIQLPVLGLLVAYQTPTGSWERGVILELHKARVKTFLVDVGSTINCNWFSLKLLESRYFKYPPQAYLCSLSDTLPKEEIWSKEAIEMLAAYQNKPLKVVNPVKEENVTKVMLIACNSEIDICINALMVRENLASCSGIHASVVEFHSDRRLLRTKKPTSDVASTNDEKGHSSSSSVAITQSDSKMSHFDEAYDDYMVKVNGAIRMKVEVLRVISPGEFYVCFLSFNDKFKELFSDMQLFYSDSSNIELKDTWNKSDKCAIKVDNEWKRGAISHQGDGDEILVSLIDEGTDITSTLSNVTPLHVNFCQVFHRAIKCCLGGIIPAGSSSWTATSIMEMKEFIKMYVDSLYIANMKNKYTESGRLPVELFHRGKIPATAISSELDEWFSLNHQLRMKGSARGDSDTKWDSQGNIIGEPENMFDDSEEFLVSLLKKVFHVTPEGVMDYSKSLPTVCFNKPKWFPPEPLRNLTFVGKPTYVGQNCEVYVQNSTNEALGLINEECCQLCNGKAAPDPPIEWEVGDICIAKFHIDKAWYRGEIIKINVTGVREVTHMVRFVDYGNEEFISENDLRPAVGMSMRPIQVHVCYFDNLVPTGDNWCTPEIDAIHKLLVDKNCQIELRKLDSGLLAIKHMIILPEGKHALSEILSRGLGVTLEAKRRSKRVNEETASGFTIENVPPSPALTINWLSFYDKEDRYEMPEKGYKLFEIPVELDDTIVEVNSIFSPTLFMIQIIQSNNEEIVSMLTEYGKLLEIIQSEAESQPPLEPPYSFKECCCQFDEDRQWYRAIVLHDFSEVDGSVMVQFVDYGNVEKKPIDQVRQLKSEWFLIPVLSLPSELYGYEFSRNIPAQEAMLLLQEVLQGAGTVIARIKERGKNFSVELRNEQDELLYQRLIEQGYLISPK